MKNIYYMLFLVFVSLLLISSYGNPSNESNRKIGEHEFSGPYTYKNLSIFLIHGENKIKGQNFLTLDEALEKKKVIVYETGSVNELEIENVSKDKKVYILSGDIVKGGKQDRVIQYDNMLPPGSGKIKIASFCVEQGRWSRRGGEKVGEFSKSKQVITSKDLKLSVRKKKSQSEVWTNVAKTQKKLADNVGTDVRDKRSESSLQLTLENEKVQKASLEYSKNLLKIIEGKDDVIGFAFAINGEVNSIDLFGSSFLFKKLWGKLLDSSIIEAIAEYDKDKKFAGVKAEDIVATMSDAEKKGKKSERGITKQIRAIEKETGENILFETVDASTAQKHSIRKSYIKKKKK